MTISRSFYLLLIVFPFYSTFSFAQSSQDVASIDKEVDKLKGKIGKIGQDSKQEEILLRLKEESEKISYDDGVLLSGDKLLLLYSMKNRNEKVVELGNQLKKITINKKDPKGTITNIYRRTALALGYIGLDDASMKDFKTAMKYAETIDNADRKLYLLSLCYGNLNLSYTKKQFDNKKYRDSSLYTLSKSLELLSKIKDNSEAVPNDQKYDEIAFTNMRLGILYLERPDAGNLEKAEKHLQKALAIYENKKYKTSVDNRIMMLNQMSWLYLEKKDYSKSIDFSKRALELEKHHPDPYHRVESFEFLANSYLETGEKEQSQFYMDKYTLLKDSLNLADKKAANESMKEMVSEVKDDHKEELNKLWIWVAAIFLTATTITWILWRRRNKILHHKYEQIIDKLNNKTANNPIKLPVSQTKNVISNETNNDLIVKLETFENSEKFLRPDITIGFLSGQFNTNPKYLSEIIKKSKSQNFSNYINNLRIDHIVGKLYNEPKYREYKISYLAEQCGFASPQVFIIAFRKVNGVTPFYFIQQLKNIEAN